MAHPSLTRARWELLSARMGTALTCARLPRAHGNRSMGGGGRERKAGCAKQQAPSWPGSRQASPSSTSQHAHIHANVCTRTRNCTLTRASGCWPWSRQASHLSTSRAHAHANTCTRTRMRVRLLALEQAGIPVIQARTHTHMHAQTHAHAHAQHMHTRTSGCWPGRRQASLICRPAASPEGSEHQAPGTTCMAPTAGEVHARDAARGKQGLPREHHAALLSVSAHAAPLLPVGG